MVKKILITRPQIDADILAEEIEALGFEVLIEPMLIIENIEINLPDLSLFDGFIFTSSNGVRSFSNLSNVRDQLVFTVGEKTAYEAIQAGFSSVKSSGRDVDDLIEFLRYKKGVYAHFRGQYITKSLVEALSDSRDIEIKEFLTYKANKRTKIPPNVLKNIENNDVSDILFYSKRTAETFAQLVQQHGCTSFVRSIKALCLADSMVECLSVLPWKEIQVAKHPDQGSMLELLK